MYQTLSWQHLCGSVQDMLGNYERRLNIAVCPSPSGSVHVVPTVLVFGIATSTSAIHNSLTQAASSSLSIEQFAAQSPIAMLNTIVEEVGRWRTSSVSDGGGGGGGGGDLSN